jgi:hypothetical protein
MQIRSARDLFSQAEVARMTANQFFAAYDKRGGDPSEAGYDDAAYYYADAKEGLHDRQARKASPALAKQVREIRIQVGTAEMAVINAGWVRGIGTMYVHTCNRWCMGREDAIGAILSSLQTHRKARRPVAKLLRHLASLDKRLPGRIRPYHQLAAAISGLPYQTIRIMLKREQSTVDLVVGLRRQMLTGIQ